MNCKFKMDIYAMLDNYSLSLPFPISHFLSLFLLPRGLCVWAVSFLKWVWDDAVRVETGETMLMILNLATLSNPPQKASTLYSPDTRASWNNYIVMLGEKHLWGFACISVCICLCICVSACLCTVWACVNIFRQKTYLMSDASMSLPAWQIHISIKKHHSFHFSCFL